MQTNNLILQQLDNISKKFTATGVAAIEFYKRISNAAITYGKNFLKGIVIDPISQGWGEYGLKMGSIQTIMAGTGESLDVVKKKLEELNEYSDQTIYSFSDMTTNIGKFTNAGVQLDKATAAIKGVANAAALSGANANEASRAMYNFAQALSKGEVQLIDWRSIENANMATKEFKEQIILTARERGLLAEGNKTLKGAEVTFQSFTETLKDGWFTSDVMIDVLNKYADDTTEIGKRAKKAATEVKTFHQLVDTLKEAVGSGWAMSFEHVVGDFAEAKSLFTGLSDFFGGMIEKGADARNKILLDWKALGGRDDFIRGIVAVYNTVSQIGAAIKKSLTSIFSPITGEGLANATKKFKEFAERMYDWLTLVDKDGNSNLLRFQKILRAITSVFKFLIGLLKDGFKYIWNVLKSLKFGDLFSKTFNKIVEWADKITSFFQTLKGKDKFIKFIAGLKQAFFEFASFAKKISVDVFNKIGEWLGILANKIGEKLPAFIENVGIWLDKIKTWFKESETIKWLGEKFKIGLTKVGGAFKWLVDKFGGVFDNVPKIFEAIGNFFKGIKMYFKDGDRLKRWGHKIKEFVKPVGDAFVWIKTKIVDVFNKWFGPKNDDLSGEYATRKRETFFDKIKRIFSAPAKVFDWLKNLGSRIKDALSVFGSWIKTKWDSIKEFISSFFVTLGDVLKTIWNFIQEHKIALFIGGLFIAVVAVVFKIIGVVKTLTEAFLVMQKNKTPLSVSNKSDHFAKNILALSGFILAITLSIKMLQNIPANALIRTVVSVTGMITVLTLLMAISSKLKVNANMGKNFMAMSVSVWLLVVSIKKMTGLLTEFSDENKNKNGGRGRLVEAILYVGGILTALTIVGKLASSKRGIANAPWKSIAGMALGISILIRSLKPLTKYNWRDFLKITAGLLILTASIGGLLAIIGRSKTGQLSVKGLMTAALGIAILVRTLDPLKKYSHDEWVSMTKGLGSITVAMGLLMLVGKVGKSGFKMGGMIAAALGIAMIINAVEPFRHYKNDDIDKMKWAIIAISGSLSLVMFTIGRTRLTGILSAMAVMASVALTISVITESLKKIQDVDRDKIKSFMIGLTLLIGVNGLSSLFINISRSVSTLISTVSIVMLIKAVSSSLNEIEYVDTTKIVAFTDGLTKVLLSMGVLSIGAGAGAALSGIGGMLGGVVGIVGIIAAVITSFGALKGISGFQEFINGAFSGIGEAIGSAVAGFEVGKMKYYALSLREFDDFKHDEKGIANAISATAQLKELSSIAPEKGFFKKLSDVFVGSDFQHFMTDMVTFGSGMRVISHSFINIDDKFPTKVNDAVDTSVKIAEQINRLNSQEYIIAGDGLFEGTSNFRKTLGRMSEYVGHISSFSKILDNTDLTNFNAAIVLMMGLRKELEKVQATDLKTPDGNTFVKWYKTIADGLYDTSRTGELIRQIQNGVSTVVKAVSDMITKVRIASSTALHEFVSLGENIAYGVARGIRNGTYAAIEAITELARTINIKYREELEIRSPSRKMIRDGEYTVAGVGLGIEKGQERVWEKAKKFGKGVLEGIRSQVTDAIDANKLLRGEIDFLGNKITPANNIQKPKPNGSNKRIIPSTILGTVGLGISQRKDLEYLGQKVDNLALAMTQMRIVMDSGALVGSIKADMNRQLGVDAFYEGRL